MDDGTRRKPTGAATYHDPDRGGDVLDLGPDANAALARVFESGALRRAFDRSVPAPCTRDTAEPLHTDAPAPEGPTTP